MTKSFSEFIDTCFGIKVFLKLTSYELHHYNDGSYAVFSLSKIDDLTGLMSWIGKLDCRIYADNSSLYLKVFEDISEY